MNIRKEGENHLIGFNFTFIWNKVSKSFEVSYHAFNPIMEESTLRSLRIRFNLYPFFIYKKSVWNRVEAYLWMNNLKTIPQEVYEDLSTSPVDPRLKGMVSAKD